MISIITVVKNGESLIEGTVRSVINQSYRNIEYIVVDGASSDKTTEILRCLSPSIDVLISEPDMGIYDAINKGIKRASGDFMMLLHAGDYFASNKSVSEIVDFIEKGAPVDFIFTNVAYFSGRYNADKSRFLRYYHSSLFSRWMLPFGLMPAHTGVCMRTAVVDKVGWYTAEFQSAGDFEFLFRALWLENLPYRKFGKVSVHMALGGMSSSGLESYVRTTNEIRKVLKKYGIGFMSWFLWIRFFVKVFGIRTLNPLKLFL